MLDPASPIPLYHQISTVILDQILEGKWTPGELLPSEGQLAKEYQVSRATIRRALARLQREGWVSTRKGKGSIVAKPKIEQDLMRFYSLARSFGNTRQRVYSKTLRQEESTADSIIAKQLGVRTEDPIVVIERLRHVDNEPIMVETSYVPSGLCPDLASAPNVKALYDLLETEYGIHIARAEEFLQAVKPTAEEAHHLGIAKEAPVFLVERISFDPQDQAVEFRRSVIRGDRFRYKVELRQG